MDTVRHISTTDNVDELNRLYSVSGSKHASQDAGNVNNVLSVFRVHVLLTSTIAMFVAHVLELFRLQVKKQTMLVACQEVVNLNDAYNIK